MLVVVKVVVCYCGLLWGRLKRFGGDAFNLGGWDDLLLIVCCLGFAGMVFVDC